jgi:hypothetical protein
MAVIDATMSTLTVDQTGRNMRHDDDYIPTLAKLISAHRDIHDPDGQVALELGYIDSDKNTTYN